jgi:hypothetical protein
MSSSYVDLHLETDNGWRLITKLYDKRDDITFPMVNFSFISSNIPASRKLNSTYHNDISHHLTKGPRIYASKWFYSFRGVG